MVLKPVNSRAAQDVSQQDESQSDKTNQGHSCPDVKQEIGRAGINERLHQQGGTGGNPGRQFGFVQEIDEVAGLTPATVQNRALKNVPIGAVGQIERDGGEQQPHRATGENQRRHRLGALGRRPRRLDRGAANEQDGYGDHQKSGADEENETLNLYHCGVAPGSVQPERRFLGESRVFSADRIKLSRQVTEKGGFGLIISAFGRGLERLVSHSLEGCARHVLEAGASLGIDYLAKTRYLPVFVASISG